MGINNELDAALAELLGRACLNGLTQFTPSQEEIALTKALYSALAGMDTLVRIGHQSDIGSELNEMREQFRLEIVAILTCKK